MNADTAAGAGNASGAVTPIKMPQPGQSMEEGTIVRWLAAEGDAVQKGDILFEVETDKAVVEVEATDSGRLARILVGEGETAPVQATVALLAAEGVDVAGYLSTSGEEARPVEEASADAFAQAQSPPPQPSALVLQPSSGRVAASPLARKAAAARGVPLESVGNGSGPRGRIMLCDVERAAPQAPSAGTASAAVPSAPPSMPVREGGQRRPMSRMRRAIARNLTAATQTIPHFSVTVTAEADALLARYRDEKVQYPCSLNDLITLAVSHAVMEFPAFRSRIDGDDVIEYPDANIGIAVGVEDGLVVPVLRAADTRNLKGIAAETRRLVENARAGKVEGMGEGVFTISNLGMFGVEAFTALINPPESGILAVGAVREEVVVKDGAFRAGHRLTLTLSADHRLIDGLLAARFMARLKEMLETPAV